MEWMFVLLLFFFSFSSQLWCVVIGIVVCVKSVYHLTHTHALIVLLKHRHTHKEQHQRPDEIPRKCRFCSDPPKVLRVGNLQAQAQTQHSMAQCAEHPADEVVVGVAGGEEAIHDLDRGDEEGEDHEKVDQLELAGCGGEVGGLQLVQDLAPGGGGLGGGTVGLWLWLWWVGGRRGRREGEG